MSKKLTLILTLICTLVLGWNASAQSYVRYVKPEDFGTKTLYADSVLTTITLPRGVSKLSNYYKFNVAAFELFQILEDSEEEIMQVWVCGSASPDGLWADNVKLSEARTRNAVEYLKSVMNIPDFMIHAESLNEDWDKLAELCGQYLSKGRSVLVEGRLQMDSWEKDGVKHQKLKVRASTIKFLPQGDRLNGGAMPRHETIVAAESESDDIPF